MNNSFASNKKSYLSRIAVGVFSLIFFTSCSSGYQNSSTPSSSLPDEQEVAYQVSSLSIELDGAINQYNSGFQPAIYQMHRVAADLAQLTIYYPNLACDEAIRADNAVVSTPNGVSPTFGMIKQTCPS